MLVVVVVLTTHTAHGGSHIAILLCFNLATLGYLWPIVFIQERGWIVSQDLFIVSLHTACRAASQIQMAVFSFASFASKLPPPSPIRLLSRQRPLYYAIYLLWAILSKGIGFQDERASTMRFHKAQ